MNKIPTYNSFAELAAANMTVPAQTYVQNNDTINFGRQKVSDSKEMSGSDFGNASIETGACVSAIETFIERMNNPAQYSPKQINASKEKVLTFLESIPKLVNYARTDIEKKKESGIPQRVGLAMTEEQKINQHLATIDEKLQQTGIVDNGYTMFRKTDLKTFKQ